MSRIINRLKLVFLGVFAVLVAGMFGYHAYFVWPGAPCDAKGRWCDPETRICARPVLISDITGRTLPEKKAAEARAAAAAAAEAETPAAN